MSSYGYGGGGAGSLYYDLQNIYICYIRLGGLSIVEYMYIIRPGTKRNLDIYIYMYTCLPPEKGPPPPSERSVASKHLRYICIKG